MPKSNPQHTYAAIGVFGAGESRPQLMSCKGRVIVFDTPAVAQDCIPLLGDGRDCVWDNAGETAWFLPLDPQGVNRLCILTGYDPYNLPAGVSVPSETRHRDWKHHLHWASWLFDRGQMQRRTDGTYANLAAGEKV